MKKEIKIDEKVRIVKIPNTDFLYNKTGYIIRFYPLLLFL